MNKFVLFLCLFAIISSACVQSDDKLEAKNCTSVTNLTEDEKKLGDSCCFVTYKKDDKTVKACGLYNKKDVPAYVKNNSKNFTKLSIVCSSNWISYSLFLVALIFMI